MPHARIWLSRALIALVAVGCVAWLTLRGTTAPLDTWLYDRILAGVDQPVDDRMCWWWSMKRV